MIDIVDEAAMQPHIAAGATGCALRRVRPGPLPLFPHGTAGAHRWLCRGEPALAALHASLIARSPAPQATRGSAANDVGVQVVLAFSRLVDGTLMGVGSLGLALLAFAWCATGAREPRVPPRHGQVLREKLERR
jgi:hypothetical protein